MSHALVFLTMYVAGGLSVPVLSLMLIARGATVELLPISIGITLAVTCAFEVPSGVMSDVLGRRATFVAAMVLQAGAYFFLLAGTGFATVLVSSVLRGLALAARTGSLEAIEIDRVLDMNHEGGARLAALDGLNGRLALLETAGTAAGGLLGGMLAALDGTYVLLIVSVVFLSAVSLAGALVVFPRDVRSARAGMRDRLRDELAAIAATAKRRRCSARARALGIRRCRCGGARDILAARSLDAHGRLLGMGVGVRQLSWHGGSFGGQCLRHALRWFCRGNL